MPNRHHSDWRYVNHTLEQNLPSFVHFYRLWIFPRAMRTFKLPRFFPKPREIPLPDMHLLGWKDVAWRIFQFMKLGFCGWWDERTLVDMKILHIEQQMFLQDILKETSSCPREYFRDLLYSVMIPRATLLRFVPQLTPVAFFIQQMASTPLYMAPWPLPPPSEPETPIISNHTQGTFSGYCGGRLSTALKCIFPSSPLESHMDPTDLAAVSIPPAVIPSLEPSTEQGLEPIRQETPEAIPSDQSASLSIPPPFTASINGNAVVSTSEVAIIGDELNGTLPTSGLNIRPKPASTLLKATTGLTKLHFPMNMRLSLPSSLSRVPLAPIKGGSSIQIQPEPPQQQPTQSQPQPTQSQPQPDNPTSNPTISRKILLPPIQPLNNVSIPLQSNIPLVPTESQKVISAAASKRREKRMKKKGNHREQVRILEEQLKKHDEEHVQYWSIYMAAPYKFLHCCSLFPICYQGKQFAGPSWMWFMNLGQFALGMWMAFTPSVGSLMSNPALRDGLVFLTYAVILPSALSIALRASIPLGRFIGVEDGDFIPFKDCLSLFKASTWDDYANNDKSSIDELSLYVSSVASEGDMERGQHGIGSATSDVDNFLYGIQGISMQRSRSNDLMNRAAAMMLDDDDDNEDMMNGDKNENEIGFEDVNGNEMNHYQQRVGEHHIPINPW